MIGTHTALFCVALVSCLNPGWAARSTADALTLLVPFSTLGNSGAGKAALDANLRVTESIQHGTWGQPALEPFAAQQARALKDAFITSGNATELADGLGSTLGGIYQAHTLVTQANGAEPDISRDIGKLLLSASTLTGADSNAGKFFFADRMQKPGNGAPTPVPASEAAIMQRAGGTTDIYGKAYSLPAGAPGADEYGDSRPFMVNKSFLRYDDPDYFGAPSENLYYLTGPAQDLRNSPSFPSGHTTYGFTEGILFAFMVPVRYRQMLVRAAEYGNNRIVIGAHYAMDVIAGRTLALYDLAQLLAEEPGYQSLAAARTAPIANFRTALQTARENLTEFLSDECGKSIKVCAAEDTSRFADASADRAFYESTLTYGLPVVYPAQAGKAENVARLAPEAGWLLKAPFPYLTLAKADAILTATEAPGGGFLDNGSPYGVYSRLDLLKAADKAEARALHAE